MVMLMGEFHHNIDEKGMNIEPVDGIYFSDRKREELFPKLQKVVDKVFTVYTKEEVKKNGINIIKSRNEKVNEKVAKRDEIRK